MHHFHGVWTYFDRCSSGKKGETQLLQRLKLADKERRKLLGIYLLENVELWSSLWFGSPCKSPQLGECIHGVFICSFSTQRRLKPDHRELILWPEPLYKGCADIVSKTMPPGSRVVNSILESSWRLGGSSWGDWNLGGGMSSAWV